MSLYGTDAEFCFGAIENAVLVQRDWPTWSLRICHDNLVPNKMLSVLRSLDVNLVPKSAGVHAHDHAGHLWRFIVLEDANVTRYLVRDADARLSKRDKRAVDEWIQSGLYFHVMRDHPQHVNEILAGMWGAVGGLIRPQMLEPIMKSVAEVPFNEDKSFCGILCGRTSATTHSRTIHTIAPCLNIGALPGAPSPPGAWRRKTLWATSTITPTTGLDLPGRHLKRMCAHPRGKCARKHGYYFFKG